MYDLNQNLIDQRELLKIKRNTLIAETAIIRKAENKLRYHAKRTPNSTGGRTRVVERRPVPCPMLYERMRNHRVGVVRWQSRLTGLALGFIRGRDLSTMEQCPTNLLKITDWNAIRAMVVKYGNKESVAHCDNQRVIYLGKQYGTKVPHVKENTAPAAVVLAQVEGAN